MGKTKASEVSQLLTRLGSPFSPVLIALRLPGDMAPQGETLGRKRKHLQMFPAELFVWTEKNPTKRELGVSASIQASRSRCDDPPLAMHPLLNTGFLHCTRESSE